MLADSHVFAGGGLKGIHTNALKQIEALQNEKSTRTPAQQKMDSQLVYASKRNRKIPFGPEVSLLQIDLKAQVDGKIMVDIDAEVTPALLTAIETAGGKVMNSFPRFRAIRALLAVDQIEDIAAHPNVKFIGRAAEAETRTGSVTSEGDITHKANLARTTFGITGAGVKVGVLSDSVLYLSNSQSSGDLGTVTVLSGQSGTTIPGNSGEGTAMLEIIHDLAPGAALYFATAFNSEASFAQNILDLRSAGCDIIVDDVLYFDESPFQDGIVARAVNTVTASGALYFSSAGNSGNKTNATAGTWEGDFVDGGTAGVLYPKGGRIHDFGTALYNTVASGGSSRRVDLFWSDPSGASSNDYDVYVLDSSGAHVLRSSTTTQNGSQNPYESLSTLNVGERIVIVKASGSPRFLHLETGRGVLTASTSGNTRGHSAASNAFCVAAVDAATSYPNPFSGGSTNPVEYFSSDGPRRMFYNTNGIPFTPGNLLADGGIVLQKPDITAADGAGTSVPGFDPFFGTSAAAPHAAAIAALLKSFNPWLTTEQIRTALTGTVFDIEANGVDQTAGYGIVMALEALHGAPLTPQPVLFGSTFNDTIGGNGNGFIDPGETIHEVITWTNMGGAVASNLSAILLTPTPGITMLTDTATYSNLAGGGSTTNEIPFSYRLSKMVPAGTEIAFTTRLSDNEQIYTGLFMHVVGKQVPPTTNTFTVTPPAKGIFDTSTIYITNMVTLDGTNYIDDVNVGIRLDHARDNQLVIALQHPDTTEVLLANRVGSSSDKNFGIGYPPNPITNTVFDDQAAIPISAGTGPFVGTFRPSGNLSNFIGKTVNGAWRLRIQDTATGRTGTFFSCFLQIVSHSALYTNEVYNNPPLAGHQALAAFSGLATNVILEGSDLDDDPITFHIGTFPDHGALSCFNATNGTLVYTPYRVYAGLDYFTFTVDDGLTNSALGQVDITTVFLDSAVDGVPDWWRQKHFGGDGTTTDDVSSALADPDRDGMNNGAEYLSNTDPTNRASFFRLYSMSVHDGNMKLDWQAGGGTWNYIQAGERDENGGYPTNFTNITSGIFLPGEGDINTNYLDILNGADATGRFYRIRIGP